MFAAKDAQDGFQLRYGCIGQTGPVLVYADATAVIQITEHGSWFHIDIWYTGRRPARYRTRRLDSARRVGLKALKIAADGWEIDGGNTYRGKRRKRA